MTSYLNTDYGTLYEHTGTIYQSVYTHYLIVGMMILLGKTMLINNVISSMNYLT